MGRLIDVDALKADYGMAEDCKDCKTGYRSCEYDRIYSKMDFCGWIDDAPTVDAVEVVRCKDCKWWKHFRGGLGNCKHPKFVEPLTENYHFCGYGEPKDGDGNDQ